VWYAWAVASLHFVVDGDTLYNKCRYPKGVLADEPHPTSQLGYLPIFLGWGFVAQALRSHGLPACLTQRWMSALTHVMLADNLAWCLFLSFTAILTLRLDRVRGCSPFLWSFANFSVVYSLVLLLLLNLQNVDAIENRDSTCDAQSPDEIMACFPKLAFSASDFEDGGRFEPECAICCEAFGENQEICKACHVFHYECLRTWFRFRHTCPVCRRDFAVEYAAVRGAMFTDDLLEQASPDSEEEEDTPRAEARSRVPDARWADSLRAEPTRVHTLELVARDNLNSGRVQ